MKIPKKFDIYKKNIQKMITKRTKLFEEFLNEKATAEVVSTETVKLKKNIDTLALDTLALTTEIKALEEQVKALKNLRDPKVKVLIEKMKEVKATSITVEKDTKKIVVKVVKTPGRITYPYKEISEALAGVNKKMTAMNADLKETLKKVNDDKEELEFKVEESVLDVIGKWFSSAWAKLTKKFNDFIGAADDLHKVTEKL
jgi:chromosome segregation ATPase